LWYVKPKGEGFRVRARQSQAQFESGNALCSRVLMGVKIVAKWQVGFTIFIKSAKSVCRLYKNHKIDVGIRTM
jgi:hypothetical protein